MRELSKYEQYSKRLKMQHGEAWWYATKQGIDLHIDAGSGDFFRLTIPIGKVREYLKRMAEVRK